MKMTKATDTNYDYVIYIAFRRTVCKAIIPQCLVYTHIACLALCPGTYFANIFKDKSCYLWVHKEHPTFKLIEIKSLATETKIRKLFSKLFN